MRWPLIANALGIFAGSIRKSEFAGSAESLPRVDMSRMLLKSLEGSTHIESCLQSLSRTRDFEMRGRASYLVGSSF